MFLYALMALDIMDTLLEQVDILLLLKPGTMQLYMD